MCIVISLRYLAIAKTSFVYQNQEEMGKKYSKVFLPRVGRWGMISLTHSQKKSESSFFQNANFIGEETKFSSINYFFIVVVAAAKSDKAK